MRIDGRLFTCAIYLSTPIPFSYPVLKLAIVAAHGLRVKLPTATMHAQRFTVFAAMASALAGTLTGSYLVEKMTYRTIQFLVSVMVLGIAVSLSGSGVIDKWFSD